jgi:hypothetical protein
VDDSKYIYAERGDKYVEKDGQLVTDAEKRIKVQRLGKREVL